MNQLQIFQLEKLCIENDLDTSLIDNSISYAENKGYLESLLVKDLDDLADVYARTYAQWEEATSVQDRYGIDDKTLEEKISHKPITFKAVIQYRFRTQVVTRGRVHNTTVRSKTIQDLIALKLDLCKGCMFYNKCPSRVKVDVRRNIIRYYGTKNGLSSVMDRLRENRVKARVVKVRVYRRGSHRKIRFVANHWLKTP